MRRWVLSVVMLATLLALGFNVYQWCFNGQPSDYAFSRIKSGQTLEEVTAILGPGREISPDQVPTCPSYAARLVDGKQTTRVVEGDRFFVWRAKWSIDGGMFYLSFKDNKVVEKHHDYQPLF